MGKRLLAVFAALTVIAGMIGLALPANALPASIIISDVSPSSGSTAGGDTVVITGSGFTGTINVTIGTTPAVFTVDSDTQITVTTPASPFGAGVADVEVVGALETAQAVGVFTYVAPATAPSAPLNLAVTAVGDGQVSLSWDAPASDGGSPITGYTVRAADWVNPTISMDVTGTTATVTGLTNGTEYEFWVYATNAVDAGLISVSVFATPTAAATAPSVPLNVTATPGNGQITVTWDAPASDGGSPITEYGINYDDGEPAIMVTAPASSYTITGLTNGTTYTIGVYAKNTVGNSGLSSTVTATPTAPAPAPAPAPKQDPAPQTVTVEWNAGINATCSFTTSTVPVNTKVNAPECTLNGYVLKGWDREVPFIATNNVTVTAKWQQIPGNVMPGASTLLPKSVKFTYGYIGTVPVDTFVVVDNKGQLACSSVQSTEFANTCTAVGFGEGTYYVFAQANGVDGPRMQIDVAKEKTITITDCERNGDGIKCFGTSTGYDKGAILSPWVRFPGQTGFSQGTVQITVDKDGDWSWGRKTPKRTAVQIRHDEDNVRSNTVVVEAR